MYSKQLIKCKLKLSVNVFYCNNMCVLALVPIPNEFEKKLRQNPTMHDQKYAKQMFGSSSELAPLVLP